MSPLLDPMQISCDMTGGSSGGGWILDSNSNGIGDAGESLVSVELEPDMPPRRGRCTRPYMAAGDQGQALYNSLK